MRQISIAKALKLKNELAGELGKVHARIQIENSKTTDQVRRFDMPELLTQAAGIREQLIEVKSKIQVANVGIVNEIVRMAELKSYTTTLQGISTREGKEIIENYRGNASEVIHETVINAKDLDKMIKESESSISDLQDQVDAFNHNTKIDISF